LAGLSLDSQPRAAVPLAQRRKFHRIGGFKAMNQYRRLFVLLNHDSGGYVYKERPPSGRCVLEISAGAREGKISLWAQGLNSEVLYKVCLMFRGQDGFIGVTVGSLAMDTKGKGEFKLSFGRNLFQDRDVDSLTAVFVTTQTPLGIITPLTGFLSERVIWKDKIVWQIDGKAEKTSEVPGKNNLSDSKISTIKETRKNSKEVIGEARTITGNLADAVSAGKQTATAEIYADGVIDEEAEPQAFEHIHIEQLMPWHIDAEKISGGEQTVSGIIAEDMIAVVSEPPFEQDALDNTNNDLGEGFYVKFREMAQKLNQELTDMKSITW
jgi:hypothetical protein